MTVASLLASSPASCAGVDAQLGGWLGAKHRRRRPSGFVASFGQHEHIAISHLREPDAVIAARTSASSTSTMRAPSVPTYWSVACTSCPPGADTAPAT